MKLGFTARCVICAATPIHRHHAGGRWHVAWFLIPLCIPHHNQLHAFLTIAGVKLEYTANVGLRLVRGLKACLIAMLMLAEALEIHLSRGTDEQKTESTNAGNTKRL